MNAPATVFAMMAVAQLRDLVLVCPDGTLPPLLGQTLLPRHSAEEQMERFWRGILPPKPATPPRLLCLQAAALAPLEIPAPIVKSGVVSGAGLLHWLTGPFCPSVVFMGADTLAQMKAPGPSGPPSDGEVLSRCFSFLSQRGYDGLDVPLNGKRGSHGLVVFDPSQLRLQGDSLDIVRDFDSCLGFSWRRRHLRPDERAAASVKLFCS